MDDLISRQALYEKMSEAEELAQQRVIDTRRTSPDGSINPIYAIYKTQLNERTRFKEMICDEPSVERDYNLDEWCTECKEYDQERHCCPRFNHVIRTTLQEVQEERKKRKWIEFDSDDKYDVIKCPCCKHIFTVDSYHWTDIGFIKDDFKFCPNCGADMRGEKK